MKITWSTLKVWGTNWLPTYTKNTSEQEKDGLHYGYPSNVLLLQLDDNLRGRNMVYAYRHKVLWSKLSSIHGVNSYRVV